jgi:filamentous hemagglutinin family protein
MNLRYRFYHLKSYPYFHLIGAIMVLSLMTTSSAQAQIVSDNTLKNASAVSRNGRNLVITEGTQTGNTLFHSFREFSIPRGDTASFRQIDRSVANIITRVTGSSASRINGTIEALEAGGDRSTANFFLINPKGIIFGSDATLNLGGSFLATTADSIHFADGSEFSAVKPQNAPLLTVSTPVGLQFGNHPASMVNRSVAPLLDNAGNPVSDFFGDPVLGLSVLPNHTLALVGGDLIFNQGALNAYGGSTSVGGRIELGSVASPDRVSLTAIEQGWRLGYGNVSALGDMRLRQATLNTSGIRGGSIQFRGDRLFLSELSEVFSNTLSASEIVNQPIGGINGGAVLVDASRVELDNSRITAGTYGRGRAGDIRIVTHQLALRNGSQITADTNAEGQGGNLDITASKIDLVNGVDLPISSLSARGNSANATGQAGTISILTGRLSLLQGAQINADNEGLGNVGRITIRASEIELAGVAVGSNGKPLLVRGVPQSPSALTAFAFPSSSGGGDINIQTQRLTLRDGAVVQITTTGGGDAGNLRIHADESIELSGFVPAGSQAPTGLLAFSGGIPGTLYDDIGIRTATGQGGNLTLTTPNLIVRNGAVVAVGSLNPNLNAKGAGNLEIQAGNIRLEDRGNLLAATASGDGGNMALQASNLLLLRRNSGISTTAGTANKDGNGGRIAIDAEFIAALPSEDSNIEANAFIGSGEQIDINTSSLIGIERRDRPTASSDITAFSSFGLSGNINISTLTDDLSRGLIALPTGIVDASQLVAQTCALENSRRSGADTVGEFAGEFIITGRGGLPPSPMDSLSSEAGLNNWATKPENSGAAIAPLASPLSNLPLSNSPPAFTAKPLASQSPLVEAQGWMRGEAGELKLVAQAPTVTPQAAVLSSAQCSSK